MPAKPNVFHNLRVKPEFETFGPFFEPGDEDAPERHYYFKLRALDPLEKIAVKQFGDELTARYCSGGYLNETGAFRDTPEGMVFGEKNHRIETSPELMQLCAEIEWMQGIKRGLFEDDPSLYPEAFTTRELCIIGATAPNVWENLRFSVRKKRAETYSFQKKTTGSPEPSPTPGSPAE
jgi:hypothetical protein